MGGAPISVCVCSMTASRRFRTFPPFLRTGRLTLSGPSSGRRGSCEPLGHSRKRRDIDVSYSAPSTHSLPECMGSHTRRRSEPRTIGLGNGIERNRDGRRLDDHRSHIRKLADDVRQFIDEVKPLSDLLPTVVKLAAFIGGSSADWLRIKGAFFYDLSSISVMMLLIITFFSFSFLFILLVAYSFVSMRGFLGSYTIPSSGYPAYIAAQAL